MRIAIIVVLAACSEAPPAPRGPGPGLPPVEPSTVVATPIVADTQAFIGVVTTRQSKVVTAEFEARVEALHVHAGQMVRAGEPIVTLDDSQLAMQVDALRAREAGARAAAGQAGVDRREAKRLLRVERQLLDGDASTPEAVRAAQANLSRSGGSSSEMYAAYTAVKTERERAEMLLSHATLTAPIDGVVSLIRVKDGDFAAIGTPVARIFDPSDRWIRFAVPPAQRAGFPVGARVEVTVPGVSGPLVATIATVSSVMEPPLQLTVVEADLDDAQAATALAEVGSMVDVRRRIP